MHVDLQLNPAAMPWPELRDAALAADDGDEFDALWVFDHLAGFSVNGSTMLETFTLLGALAAGTRRVALGTLVINVFNRQPAVVAVGAASVVAIAGRPVFIGLGAGAAPDSRWSAEMRAAGQAVEPSLPRRHLRVEHTIDVCRRLWSPERDDSLATFPLPRPAPALHVGVGSVALARLAGRRADGMNVAWHHVRRDELIAAGLAARAEAGLPRDGFSLTTYARVGEVDAAPGSPDRLEMQRRGIDRLILVARHPVLH